MSTHNIHFPEDLERKLAEEARLSHKERSELVREAVQEYVQRREQERFMRSMATELKEWLGDKRAREESRELSANLPDDDLDAIIRTETDAGAEQGQRWWK